jgi:hypothetical protein
MNGSVRHPLRALGTAPALPRNAGLFGHRGLRSVRRALQGLDLARLVHLLHAVESLTADGVSTVIFMTHTQDDIRRSARRELRLKVVLIERDPIG